MSLLDDNFDITTKEIEIMMINKIIQDSSYIYKKYVNNNNIIYIYDEDYFKHIEKRYYKYYVLYISHKRINDKLTFQVEWYWWPHIQTGCFPILINDELVNLKMYLKNILK